MQTWVYETSSNYNAMNQAPSSGSPRVFWDEAPTFVSGAAIAPGSTITIQEDSSNTATFYWIDCIDLEAPLPLTQPANSISITSYGAVANNTSIDNTTAIQNCFNAAQSQGKAVWILQNNVMSSPSLYGITVDPTAIGNAVINNNTLAAPAAGQPQFFTDASSFTIDTSSEMINQAIVAAAYNSMSSVTTESCVEGGLDVSATASGSHTVYNNVDLNGVTSMAARVASPGGGGTIAIHLDSATGTLVGTCSIPSTGGWQTWTTQTCSVSGASGYHNVYLVYSGGFNIEWFNFFGNNNTTEASSYNTTSSATTENCVEGGLDVKNSVSGSYTVYNDVNLTGVTSFTARLASLKSGATVSVRLHSPTGTLIGTCPVPNTGAAQSWANQTIAVSSSATGYHNIYLVYSGGFSIEWFAFQGGATAIAASSYSSLNGGEYLENCVEGGQDLAGIANGAYAVYNNVNLNGTTSFFARVASNSTSGGDIEVHLDSPTGTLIGTCTAPYTGGWQNWTTQSCTLTGATGTHNIYLVFANGGFNLEWFKFQ
jgi:Carbohydrate binding module (family 6)